MYNVIDSSQINEVSKATITDIRGSSGAISTSEESKVNQVFNSKTEASSDLDQISTEQKPLEQLTKDLHKELSKRIKKHALKTWLSGAFIKEIANDYAIVAVANEFSRNFITQTYLSDIESALKEITATNLGVKLVIDETASLREIANEVYSEQISLAAIPQVKTKNDPINIKDSFNFDNFILTKANRLAVLFAKAFIESRSDRHNSLYVYGDTGLGKTHLIHAIANELKKQNPNLRIKYISAESFANELFEAISTKQTAALHHRYRKLDLLILDDAQFLENKKSTQQEFLYSYEAITNAGGKVILAASKNPKDLVNVEASLQNRLSSSLVTEIFEHDFESRLEILKSKAKDKKIQISPEQLESIAHKSKSSVRELEAALNKLATYSEFGDIDDASISELFAYSLCSSGKLKGLDIEKISSTVADYFGIALEDLRSTSRLKELARARHIAIHLSRELLQISHSRIGQYFSNRKHSSIIHSIKLINAEIKKDRSTALVIEDIKVRLCG